MNEKERFTGLTALLLPFFVLCMAQCRYDAPEGHTGGNRSVMETPEGRFAEDRVILVLKEAALDKQYGVEDFPEIRCGKVEDLTGGMVALIQKQREAEKTGNWKELQGHVDQAMLMNVAAFKRILRITLPENSKKNVLEAARLLEKREDVLYAGPDYTAEYCAVPNPLPTYWAKQKSALNAISLPQAWDIETGYPIKVGVVDSGFQASHPDSAVNISMSRDFSASPWGLEDHYPPDGHGTMVAGVSRSYIGGQV